ncbi:MAG: oligosaccharide flippase family protein [Chloroflexi bacterium]|nr:oligosaccharide flippase family protein [Chloroflexota bacterium]
MTSVLRDEETTAAVGSPLDGATLARIAVRSTVWASLGTYLNQFIGFGAVLAMTRILSPEVFGFFSLGTFWSSLLNLRPKAGLSYAAIRQPHADGDLLGTYFVMDVVAGAASLALSGIAGLVLWQLGYAPQMVIVLMALMGFECISTLVAPLGMVLEKELQISRLTLVSLLGAIAAYGAAIYLAVAGAGIWSLLAVNGVTTLASLVGVYVVCKRRYPQALRLRWHFSRPLAGRLLRQGIPTGLSLAAQTAIVTQFDNFLVGTFVGYATLGFYDRAYRIANWTNILLTMVVSRVAFLTFAKVREDPLRLTQTVRLSLWVLTTLGMPIALTLVFGAEDVVHILYGPKWSESAGYLRFLTIYSFAWPFVSVGYWLSVALGHTRQTVFITATQAIALVVLATPMTLLWGVRGTILGVGLTMALSFTLSCRYMFSQVPISFRQTFGSPLLAAISAMLVLFVLSRTTAWANLPPLLRLSGVVLIACGIFFGCLFIVDGSTMVERVRYLQRRWGHSPDS